MGTPDERTSLLTTHKQDGSANHEEEPPNSRSSFASRPLLLVLALIFTFGAFALQTSFGSNGSSSVVDYLGLNLHQGHYHKKKENKIRQILQDLDNRLEGSILLEKDATAHASKTVWNRLVDFQDPPLLAVVLCHSATDVSLSVPVLHHLETHHEVPFRILSGGHNYVGWSGVLPRGILLSVQALDDFSINLSTAVATLGAAVPAWDLLKKALVPYGYGSVIGCSPNVTMGGYTLGGGIGRMARKYGLAIDQVLSYEIVLADGRLVTASSVDHSDLFWALRGGGQSSYGVVTSLTYRLHQMQDALVVATLGALPVEIRGAFLSALAAAEPDMPGEAYCEVGNDGDNWYATFYWFGTEEESLMKGEKYLKEVLLPQLLPIDVANSFDIYRKSWQELTMEDYANDGFLVDNFQGFIMKDESSVDHLDDIAENLWAVYQHQCEYLVFQFESWGGAVRDTAAPTETAFYWRDAIYSLSVLVMVPEDLHHAETIFHHCVHATNELWHKHIVQYTSGSYANYPTAALSHDPHFELMI